MTAIAVTHYPITPVASPFFVRDSLNWWSNGPYTEAVTMKKCDAEGCDRIVVRAKYCKAHYHHKFMTGQNPDGHKLRLRMPKMPTEEQLDWLLRHKTEMVGECLEWTGAYTSGGYGHCALGRIPRLVAKRKFGDLLTDDLVVRHTCDNRRCVLADHLEIGTQLKNMQDAIDRGRMARGERAGPSKLKRWQVVQIKKLKGIETQTEVARRFGVTSSAIQAIWVERTWAHVKV